MRLTIDQNAATIVKEDAGETEEFPLYSREGFELVAQLYLQVGWNEKYSYTFSWLGRPIIQLPDDLMRLQELIYSLAPDVIVETGIAHGGSLVFYASLFEAMGNGRVIGIDIDIRAANRDAIEAHRLAERISLVEGSSIAPEVVAKVQSDIQAAKTVLIVLDSDHSYAHVMAELEAYAPMVTPGSFIVATDGLMRDLTKVPRGSASWGRDNPASAAEDYAKVHDEFVLEQPQWLFNESELAHNVTQWPSAYLRRMPV